ncbi:MAG TPA: T9SS type A sorting domain-containing protein, partial [Bacteroidia bacterium]|nr:T9SS type A sorting domain-containing protein [Bacteroidia bacterium]
YRGNGVFIGSNISSRFQLWNTSGNVYATYGNSAPDDIRGTVFITRSRAIAGTLNICSGDSTVLTSGASTSVSFQWYKDGVAIPGANSISYTTAQAGHYNVWVSDECGADSLGTGVDVTINPVPVVSLGNDTAICSGGMITFDAMNAGDTYLWSDASTAQTLSTGIAGTYYVNVTDPIGCSSSDTVVLNINPLPVISLGNDTAVCSGNMITFDAMNAGSSYLWNDGSTTQTLMTGTAGTYFVDVTDVNGCSNSDTIMLGVNPLPVVNLGNDTAICSGSMITFDAMNAGSSYLWSDSSTAQTLMTGMAGTYYVDVTDMNGCSSSDTVMLSVNAIPVVNLGNDTAFCAGNMLTLDALNAGSTYMWSDASTNQTLDVTTSGNYFVDVTDTSGCSASDTIMVTVNALPTVTSSATSTNVCFDDANVSLTGTPAGGTFSGNGVTGSSFDPSAAGNGNQVVTYSYTDVNGCSATSTVTITVNACTGIEEHTAASGVTLYPNPANDKLVITAAERTSVMIFNATGDLVMNLDITPGTQEISVAGLPDGIYFVRSTDSKGASTQRLVITR